MYNSELWAINKSRDGLLDICYTSGPALPVDTLQFSNFSKVFATSFVYFVREVEKKNGGSGAILESFPLHFSKTSKTRTLLFMPNRFCEIRVKSYVDVFDGISIFL